MGGFGGFFTRDEVAAFVGVVLSALLSRTVRTELAGLWEPEGTLRCGALLAESDGATSESMVRVEGARGCALEAVAVRRVLYALLLEVSGFDIAGAAALLRFFVQCRWGRLYRRVIVSWDEYTRRDC